MSKKIFAAVSSNLFFKITMLIYAINSGWIALSALYPMAFDEQFHLGIIRLYSQRLSPFWASNPAGDALYGAVNRDPSYLYHYLLSFPYRLIEVFFHSEMSQVLILRFISIIIFGLGILIFRKVLIQAKISKTIANGVLLIFVLTPIVPLLASQINYDNLIFLILGLVILKTQYFTESLKSKGLFDSRNFIMISILCIFGSLVKYAFLPCTLAVVIYLFWHIIKYADYKRSVYKTFIIPFVKLKLATKLTLVISFLVIFGLFSERYIVNTINYGTPTPECNQVLNVEKCLAYGPWRRNYYTHKAKVENRLEKMYSNSFPRYLFTLWISQSTYHLFFVIDGATNDFKVGEAYRITRNVSIILFSVSAILFMVNYKKFRKKYQLGIFGVVIVLYLAALITQNYLDFINLGYPFAIQGRYLVPVLPIIYALMAVTFELALKSHDKVKAALFSVLVVVLVTQGGGAGTFILRSNNSWYWQKKYPNAINHYARNILKPFAYEKK